MNTVLALLLVFFGVGWLRERQLRFRAEARLGRYMEAGPQ
jgi:uncharacterized membrane protein